MADQELEISERLAFQSRWLEAQQSTLVAAAGHALDANDQYLRLFVEGKNLCPFAREGRKRHETRRAVFFEGAQVPPQTGAISQTGEVAAFSEARVIVAPPSRSLEVLVSYLSELALDESVSVAQVIFPGLTIDSHQWIEFCHQLTRLAHRQRGGADVFAVAALHPQLSYHMKNAYALIPLFRRAPDATIQWVRLSALNKLYEGRSKGSTFVDPSNIAVLLAEGPSKSLYERVAENNRQMLQAYGTERLERELSELHEGLFLKYQQLL